MLSPRFLSRRREELHTNYTEVNGNALTILCNNHSSQCICLNLSTLENDLILGIDREEKIC